jgi:hypothetical protein
VPIGAEDIAQAEAVERQQDVGRHTFPEAFQRLQTGLGDDDAEAGLEPKADRGGQAGWSSTDDENVTPDGDPVPLSLSPVCDAVRWR